MCRPFLTLKSKVTRLEAGIVGDLSQEFGSHVCSVRVDKQQFDHALLAIGIARSYKTLGWELEISSRDLKNGMIVLILVRSNKLVARVIKHEVGGSL